MRNQEDIATYTNGRNMLVATDHLVISGKYGSVHAEKESFGENRTMYSRIRFTLLEFQSKANCKFNLTVDDCRWIMHMLESNVYEWAFHREKIIGSEVSKLVIARQPKDQNGRDRNLPWYIEISNGTGNPIKRGALTICQTGSYVQKQKLYLNLSEEDFYKFMKRIVCFIEIFEVGYAPYIVNQKIAYEQNIKEKNQK